MELITSPLGYFDQCLLCQLSPSPTARQNKACYSHFDQKVLFVCVSLLKSTFTTGTSYGKTQCS